jgi:protease I
MARIAMLVDEMFEDSEFRVPYDRLRAAGHVVDIVGLQEGKVVTGKKQKERITIEKTVHAVSAGDYDAIVIPGGYSPDHLRADPDAVHLVRMIGGSSKPVAAVCHAPWMLIEAGLAYERLLTSWPSIKTDMINAGAHWIDREVVIDGNVITSRNPGDLPAFSDAILHQLEYGVPTRAEPALLAEMADEIRPPIH